MPGCRGQACGQSSCIALSNVNIKDYTGILLTNSRLRFALENGYRINVVADSIANVTFTGVFAENGIVSASQTFNSYNIFIQYFNTRLPANVTTLVATIASLPLKQSSASTRFYFPVTLSTGVALPAGLYQFDILLTPLATEPTASTSLAASNTTAYYDYDGYYYDPDLGYTTPSVTADAFAAGAAPYSVFGSGKLSIEVFRKSA